MKNRTIVAPAVESDFSKDGKLAYWKQILPQSKIEYTTKSGKRATLNFDEAYLADLAKAFDDKVLDQTPFLLADTDNKHTMDPERFRGEVVDVKVGGPLGQPGLWGKIQFPSKEAAKAVVDNPNLGVSARIREGVQTSDGKTVPRAMLHVLGTLDPQVTGMAPWMPTDLSFDPSDNILDLSGETYEGAPVADDKTPVADDKKDAPNFEAMSEAELTAWLEQNAPDALAAILAGADPEADVPEDDPVKELEPALSAKAEQDIELANQRATQAQARADEALRRMAAAEFAAYRTEKMAEGVPSWVLDLAVPVLNRPEDMVIDLSNEEGDDVNASEIVRKLVDGYKGFVDLANERGHTSATPGDDDPDKDVLAQWDAEYSL